MIIINKKNIPYLDEKEFINIVIKYNFNLDRLKKYYKKKNIKINRNSIRNRIDRYRRKGLLPLESGNKVNSGEILTGSSTLYDNEGNIKLQWIKTNIEKDNTLNAYKEAIQEIINEINPVKPIPSPIIDSRYKDMMTFYPLPDLHFGMLVDRNEVSHEQNWDLKIATKWVLGAMEHLVNTSPNTKYAVITDLGDLLHAEDNNNRTVSGHALDTDSRHSKVVKTSFDIMRKLIDKALEKHEKVYFYSVEGNHSALSSVYIKAFLSAWYKDEPRVIIEERNKPQQYHVFDKVILGFTHGHMMKPEKAGEVMVMDNEEWFSHSKYRYYHFGHFHKNQIKETPLCTIEIHKNITVRDNWADSMGFRGTLGEAKAIYYHSEYGEIGRSKFNITMLKNKK